jgi:hypothetical protein
MVQCWWERGGGLVTSLGPILGQVTRIRLVNTDRLLLWAIFFLSLHHVTSAHCRSEIVEDKLSVDRVEACSSACALRNRVFNLKTATKDKT